MLLDQLRVFLAVAAAGSFSRAAALSDSTQSAVSKRVLALERELGATLFERTGRGARMTDAGRALLPRADVLVKDADALADSSRPTRRDRAAPCASRSSRPPRGRWCATSISACAMRTRPSTCRSPKRRRRRWSSGCATGATISACCRNRRAQRCPAPSRSSRRHCSSCRARVIRLTRRPTVAFDRLAKLPLVVAVMPNGGRVLLEEVARQRGVRLNVAMDVYSIHLIKKLVRDGLAYTIAFASAIADEIASGRARRVAHRAPIDDPGVLPVDEPRAPPFGRRAGGRALDPDARGGPTARVTAARSAGAAMRDACAPAATSRAARAALPGCSSFARTCAPSVLRPPPLLRLRRAAVLRRLAPVLLRPLLLRDDFFAALFRPPVLRDVFFAALLRPLRLARRLLRGALAPARLREVLAPQLLRAVFAASCARPTSTTSCARCSCATSSSRRSCGSHRPCARPCAPAPCWSCGRGPSRSSCRRRSSC